MQEIQTYALSLACGVAGVSVGLITIILSKVIFGIRPTCETFEESRRASLRKYSGLYQRFEPLVDELCRFFPDSLSMDQLSHHIRLTKDISQWKPSEFMAIKTIESVLIGFVVFLFLSVFAPLWLGLGFAIVTSLMYPTLSKNSVINGAKKRLKKIKLRMPFAIDQISLMMEAGAGFEDSLRTVVADNQMHPLSEEFSEVVRQMSLGRPRSQALSGFRDRMADDDVSEIVFAIVKGEELGTPISNILREQASQMRLKRSQWGEKAAAEAEVQMVFPGMITMVACLLVIVAPILLPVVVKMLNG